MPNGDKIVIEVVLRPIDADAEFEKAGQRAARRVKKGLDSGKSEIEKVGEEFGEKFEQGFRKPLEGLKTALGPAGILGAVSAAVAGLFVLAKSAADAREGFADLASKTGLSAKTLSAFNVILEDNDADIKTLVRSVQFLQTRMGEAAAGNKKLATEFKQLGIDIRQGPEEALRAIIKRYSELPTETEKAVFAQKAFGRGGQELRATLNALNGDLDGTIQKLSDLGLVIDDEAAASAERFTDSLNTLLRTLDALKNNIGGFFIPAFTGIITLFNESTKAVRRLVSGTDDLRTSIFKILSLGLIGSTPGLVAGAGEAFAPPAPPAPPEVPLGRLGGGRNKALEEAKKFRDALFEQERSALENEIKLAESARDEQLAILNDYYDNGRTATKLYYDQRLELARQGIQDEIKLVDLQVRQLRETLADTPAKDRTERVKLETQINELLFERTLLFDKLNAATAQNVRELRKIFSELGLVTSPSGIKLLAPTFEERQRTLGTALTPDEKQARDEAREASEAQQRVDLIRLDLAREQARIQELIRTGQLTEVEGERALLAIERDRRDVLIEALKARQSVAGISALEFAEIDVEIERIRSLGTELTNAQRFMRGFGSETEAVGDIFERFGRNVANSFTNIKSLFEGLRNAVKQFFNDILSNTLQKLLRGTFSGIFGGGGGFGGFGGAGGIFSTPAFNPNAGGGFTQQLGSIFRGLGGGGISAPASVSGGIASFGSVGGIPLLGLGRASGGAATGATGLSGLINRVFSGAGGGLLPLFGASLGTGIGGQSLFGQILGGIGGAAVGLGVSFGASVFGALGGGLGALGPAALAALGPIGLIAAPLLVGGFLLGKSKQRKADEEASGQFLQQAIDQIAQLREQVRSDRIDGTQARTAFDTQILPNFIQQINTLKTKSVRESRLTNQVRDLRNLFDSSVGPEIEAQNKRRAAAVARQDVFSKLIPEFATGGIVPGINRGFDSVLARLSPGEMVLNQMQQALVMARAGNDVFRKAGVPGQGSPTDTQQSFAIGGVAARGLGVGQDAPIIVDVVLAVGTDTQDQLFVSSARREAGRRSIVGAILTGVGNREL